MRKHAPAHDIDFTCGEPWLKARPAPVRPKAPPGLIEELGQFIDEVCGSHRVGPVPMAPMRPHWPRRGIPSVVFGPGNIDQAHTCDEWIDLAEVEAASEILYRLAAN